jgi:hypothetical protein
LRQLDEEEQQNAYDCGCHYYRASEAYVVSEKGWGFVFWLFLFAHRESQ